MAFDDEKNQTIVDVVKVERHGKSVILPEGVPTKRVIKALIAHDEYEQSDVAVSGDVDVFVLEGAHAFYQVLKRDFGLVNAVAQMGMFGPQPPALLTIETGLNESIQVPWGQFELPGINGKISTSYSMKDGRFIFAIRATVKRVDETKVKEIIDETKKYAHEHPIFGGKAWRIKLHDENGDPDPNPQPRFLSLNPNIMNELVFSEDVQANLNISLFTPIRHTALVREVQGSLKRGILLSGKYGTGKSMTSAACAQLATENGWTFIVVDDPNELADALRLARDYSPCVVFCEDIDRVMTGRRTVEMDEMLNVIDGVESKNLELIVVLTTNHVENIHQAALRPGRLDAIINVTPPDAGAVERLIRQYGRGLIGDDVNVTDIAQRMQGNIPAVIRELVERAKLAAIDANPHIETLTVSHNDLDSAALSMTNQLELLAERSEDERSYFERGMDTLAGAIVKSAAVALPSNVAIGASVGGDEPLVVVDGEDRDAQRIN